MSGEDVSAINSAKEELSAAMHPIAQKLYEQNQTEASGAADPGEHHSDDAANTVDADFSEPDKD